MTGKARVAMVRPSEFATLEEALSEALRLVDAEGFFRPGEEALLKPNLTLPVKNASTEKDFIRAAARVLKKTGAKLSLGDSCGAPGGRRAPHVLKTLGMDRMMEEEGISYAEFEGPDPVRLSLSGARFLKTHFVARAVSEADALVNLPRPKAHVLAGYTGAVKNYYGIMPGGHKSLCHQLGKSRHDFAEVLADNLLGLSELAPRRITLMDARKYMTGVFAPGNGPMKALDLLLAGFDEAAVDAVLLAAGNISAEEIPHLRICGERGLGTVDLSEIEVKGKSIDEVRLKRRLSINGRFPGSVTDFFGRRIFFPAVRHFPVLEKASCDGCGACAAACPGGALKGGEGKAPELRLENCLSCLSCLAACPLGAIAGKSAGIRGLFHPNRGWLHPG